MFTRCGSKLSDIERISKERQEQHKPMTPEYSKQMKIKLSDLLSVVKVVLIELNTFC